MHLMDILDFSTFVNLKMTKQFSLHQQYHRTYSYTFLQLSIKNSQHTNSIKFCSQRMQKYKIKRTLGDGTFGTVFQAVSPNNQIVAIKKMKVKYKDWEQCCDLREIKSLKKLDHPNIIKLKQVILANGQLYLVFDYLETNLLQVYSRAKQSGRNLTQSEIKSIFFKVVHGLAYLHRNGYFHRDLKPENILCHNLDVKICDFGLARQIRSRPPFTDYVSTRWYRAPELLLRSTSYNSPVDIFALACIIVELFTMQPLFQGVNEVDTMNRVVEVLGTPKKAQWPQGYKFAASMRYQFPEAKGKSLFQIMPNASVEIVQLLESMLCYSSRKRPSANEILKHRYFENYALNNEKLNNTEHQQMKISFYDKNIIQMPKNIKIQNPKQVQMRKSLYKFGDSFSSSFHKEKQYSKDNQNGSSKKLQKKQQEIKKQEKIVKKQSNPTINLTNNLNMKKGKFAEDDDHEISKKFDEMEQILLQLKMKQQMKAKNKQKTQRDRERPFEQKTSLPVNLGAGNEEQQLRLRMFSLDGGIAGSKSISNMKSPLMKGTLSLNNNNIKNI